MRLALEFYLDTPDGREWITPMALSVIARADDAGATVEDFGSILDDDHKKETGVYFIDTAEADADAAYVASTWYEVVATWTYGGEERTAYRRFYYQSTTTSALDPPTLTKVVNDGDGDGITVTVAAANGQGSERIRVIGGAQGSAMADLGGRVGSGEVAVTGLSSLTAYDIVAIHEDASNANVKSISSRRIGIVCHDGTRQADAIIAGIVAALRADANLAAYAGDGNWAKTDARTHVFDHIEDGWIGGRGPGRCPFVEVEWDGGGFGARMSGDVVDLDYELPLRLRCTVGPGTDVDTFVMDLRRCLQTDGNRYLGDSAHVVGARWTVGVLSESMLIKRREITGAIRMIAVPGEHG